MTSMDTQPTASNAENVDVPGITKGKESSGEETKEDIENSSDKEAKHRLPPVDIAAAQNAGKSNAIRTSSISQVPNTPGSRADAFKDKEKKIGHRRVDDGGKVTYKKIGTNQIMGSIQLGIQQAVGSLASKPELDVLIQDFYVVETIIFPNDGSQSTPAHTFSEFKFKVYAPIAFRHFRDLFKIQPDDYLISLCDEPLRELSNPGASGSIFYLTIDDEFIIKTVQHKEAEFLQKLLPGYYMNLNQNPRTLLPKFFGLYTYQCNAKNIRLIVMNNLLPSSIKMHQKYDLKGSTYKRKANKYERKKNSPTFKDLDFMEHHPDGILLEAETCKALIKTIERDCRVLMSFKIMDYSLLVGIHNLDQAARERASKSEKVNGADGHSSDDDGADGGFALNRSRSINRQKLVAHSTAMESIQADADPIDEEEHVPPGGIPARNVKGERLLLFLGIIDILQSYRFKKKLEHTVKAVIHDGDTISVHRPNFYAERFQKFMSECVFKKIPSPLRHSPSRKRGASVRNVLRPISQSDEGAGSPEQSVGQTRVITGDGPSKSSDEKSVEDPTSSIDEPDAPTKKVPATQSSSTGSDNAQLNLPAVLQDRPRMRHPPPPVPPRSPRGGHRCPTSTGRGSIRASSIRKSDGEGHPPVGSTPPPTWDAAMTRNASGSPKVRVKSSATHVTTVAIQDDRSEVVSVSDIQLEPRSSLTVEGGHGPITALHGRTHAWTPPLSVEGSTPTWTEGTPSFTESSSSGDLGCPTTPVRSLNTTIESSENVESEGAEMTHL